MKLSISPDIKLDLPRLIESRMLITASSGGGKSMTMRTILEATHGHFPQIILDVEGEFSTLREKYDYILAGKGGDIPADPRTAQMLARKMLELNASVIIDLYELKHTEKHRFVRLFIEALVDAPKELWGPRLLVIDEAHQFCPEKGAGTSEAWEAVIDLCEKGRKRGLGTILATQRLSKLNKDAAAECQNKIIGLANIDIDRDRSGRELGFNHKDAILTLRDLEAGEFYCIGPALCKSVTKTKINLASTSHPKIGKRTLKAPVATAKVRLLLEKLKDLPLEAEKELKTQADMMGEIRRLKQELKSKPLPIQATPVDTKALERQFKTQLDKTVKDIKDRVIQALNQELPKTKVHIPRADVKQVIKAVAPTISTDAVIPESGFGRCEKAILKFLAMREGGTFTKTQIGAMTEYSPNSGGFNNSLSKLKVAGLVRQSGQSFQIQNVQEVMTVLGSEYHAPEKSSIENWLNKLGVCPKKIYEKLLERPTDAIPKEELGEITGYQATSGGFNNSISQLCTLGLAVRDNGGIRLNPEIQGL